MKGFKYPQSVYSYNENNNHRLYKTQSFKSKTTKSIFIRFCLNFSNNMWLYLKLYEKYDTNLNSLIENKS